MTDRSERDAIVRVKPSCLLTELGDGTAVVLDLDTKFYFTLNETGLFIWKQVAESDGSTAARVAEQLHDSYDVTRELAQADVDHLLADLRRSGLIEAG